METTCLRNVLREVNLAPKVTTSCFTDATPGNAVATRYGAARRVDLRCLYTQSLVALGLMTISKIKCAESEADVDTNYVGRAKLARLRELA